MQVGRREFLRVGSITAVAFTLAHRKAMAAWTAPTLMSVGYAAALPDNNKSVRLSDASGLRIDPDLARYGARVAIIGGSRDPHRKGTPGGVTVDAIFPQERRASIWSVFGRKGFDSTSGPAGFRMAADASGTLPFAIGPQASTFNIARGGVYVLAMREESYESAPNWKRMDLVRSGRSYSLGDAPFAYLLLSVETARVQ